MKITAEDIIKIRKPKIRYPVIQQIADRFSPRHFSGEQIPEKDLNSIFEAGRHAPSGRNYQPWFYYWSENGSDAFNNIIFCLPESNHWAKSAAVLIVACYEPAYENISNPYALYDLGASVLSLILQAQHFNYYARQIGHFDKAKLTEILNINKNQKPFVIIALGKIGDYSKEEEIYLKKDSQPHNKKMNIAKKI